MSDPINKEAELLARILMLEKAQEKKPSELKPAWQRLLESNGGAALITVLIGGVFGTLLSQNFQNKQQEREQKMKLYTLSLNSQSAVATSSMELIGETVYAISSLTETKGPDFAFDPSDPEDRKDKEQQIKNIELKFNLISESWNKKALSQGFLLCLNYNKSPEIELKWNQILELVNNFQDYACKIPEGGYDEAKTTDFVMTISKLTSELMSSMRSEQQKLSSEL